MFACVCVCCLFLFPLSRSLPSTSRYILIFLSLIHFFLLSPFVLDLRHTLLLHNHSCPLSPLLSLNLIFFFSLLFYPPFSFCFRSPSLSFSIGSPSSSSLLSFSLTLFILTLPSALYKLDWWLNPTCIKVRITIFATSTRAHTYTHTQMAVDIERPIQILTPFASHTHIILSSLWLYWHSHKHPGYRQESGLRQEGVMKNGTGQ